VTLLCSPCQNQRISKLEQDVAAVRGRLSTIKARSTSNPEERKPDSFYVVRTPPPRTARQTPAVGVGRVTIEDLKGRQGGKIEGHIDPTDTGFSRVALGSPGSPSYAPSAPTRRGKDLLVDRYLAHFEEQKRNPTQIKDLDPKVPHMVRPGE
jgi:hypothetical protein